VRGRGTLRRSALAVTRGRGFAWLVDALDRATRARPDALAVLTYHRIADPARSQHLYPGLISAGPSEFEEQMRFLAARHRPLALGELLAVRRGEARLPLRSVLVTFDDGYRDFAEEAWPILKRHGIPVVLFVPTAYPGDPERSFWWDRLYSALSLAGPTRTMETPVGTLPLVSSDDRASAYRRLRTLVRSLPHEDAMRVVDDLCRSLGAPPTQSTVLSWPELGRLHFEGVVLAPHSRTHPFLDRVPLEAAREEILGSLEDLTREIGSAPRVFAYPAGGENAEVARVLGEEGFELGFTTERGRNDLREADWLRLRRINVGRASTLALLRAQLLPWWKGSRSNEGGSRIPNTCPSNTLLQSDRFLERPGPSRGIDRSGSTADTNLKGRVN
jgi:peptidoglycan/xylan/chitin deacetylase (PgdA/CDA1 family)